jgi:hypothetical protein
MLSKSGDKILPSNNTGKTHYKVSPFMFGSGVTRTYILILSINKGPKAKQKSTNQTK